MFYSSHHKLVTGAILEMESADSIEKQNLLGDDIDSVRCQKCSRKERSYSRSQQCHIFFLYALNIILAGCLLWSTKYWQQKLIYCEYKRGPEAGQGADEQQHLQTPSSDTRRS